MAESIVPKYIALYTRTDSTDLEGLECVSWQHDGETMLKVDLINFTNGCLPEWTGDASASEGSVTLIVENPVCGMGACGSCIYDWSFEVNDVAPDANVALSIDVYSYPRQGCDMADPEDSLTVYGLDIAQADLADGMVCRYVHPWDLDWLEKIGDAYLPCAEGGTCAPGLDCMPHPQLSDTTLCLLPCTADADCPHPGLDICDDGGHCVLGDVWVP